jgi:pimeloyl-ACP methyl ester carboxylesterase
MSNREPSHHRAAVNGLTLHYVEAGDRDRDCVVLLHGWPETGYAWRHVLPLIAGRYRVVVPDLRGFGASGKPATGYDMASFAADIHALLDYLGIASAHVVGQDFGATTGYTMAATWPDRVRSLTVLDMVLPGFGLENAVGFSAAGWGLWHLPFHAQPDVPEMLIAGHEHEYIAWFFRTYSYNPAAMGPDDVEVYAASLREAGGARGAFGVYRALFQSAEQNRALAARGKLAMPVLALGGVASIGPGVGECMRQVAANVAAEVVPECGHWVCEERPAWLAERLLAFFERPQR